jgi:hypothetical protein
MNYEYKFLERWILGASSQAVYDAMADFELYPRWGHPGYLEGTRQGPPGVVGTTGTLLVQGALPLKVKMKVRITRVIPGREIEIDITGDLEGRTIRTVRPIGSGQVELISDMVCNPRIGWVRALTPVLRPMFCWNHEHAVNAGVAGLARYLAAQEARPRSRPAPKAASKRTRAVQRAVRAT